MIAVDAVLHVHVMNPVQHGELIIKRARALFDSWLEQFSTWDLFVQGVRNNPLPEFGPSAEIAIIQVTGWLGGAAKAPGGRLWTFRGHPLIESLGCLPFLRVTWLKAQTTVTGVGLTMIRLGGNDLGRDATGEGQAEEDVLLVPHNGTGKALTVETEYGHHGSATW